MSPHTSAHNGSTHIAQKPIKVQNTLIPVFMKIPKATSSSAWGLQRILVASLFKFRKSASLVRFGQKRTRPKFRILNT